MRTVDGIALSFTRRTRLDGDNWDPLDVPLGEAFERYEIDILRGGVPCRTLTSDTAGVVYPAAQELADFGTPQSSLAVRIAQLSALVGRGFEAAVSVAVG